MQQPLCAKVVAFFCLPRRTVSSFLKKKGLIKISNYSFLRIEDARYHRLLIGKSGENEYRSFCFDISKWLKKYPDGIVSAMFKRPDGAEGARRARAQGGADRRQL